MSAIVTVTLNGVRVPVELDEDALAAIAEAVAPTVNSWPAWMSVTTVARYLDVPEERIRKLVTRREIPFSQEGTGYRLHFERRAIDTWLRNQTHKPKTRG